MSQDPVPVVTVSRRIDAPASVVFDVLRDPRSHPDFDGSDMVKAAVSNEVVTGRGDVFVMAMENSRLGKYQMSNEVVAFEVNRSIAWEPRRLLEDGELGDKFGHRWSFELQPDGDDATLVTESYDATHLEPEIRERVQNGEVWREAMTTSLARLEGICAERLSS